MAGTVETDLIHFTGATGGSVSLCDAITDWSNSPTLDTESKVQGTGCCSKKVSSTTSVHVYSLTSSVNLTDKCVYAWMLCLSPISATGGLRIRVEDGSANYGEMYVANNTTYGGGWECFCIQLYSGMTWDNKSATAPNISAITKVGVVFVTSGSSAKVNSFWDAVRYGTYLSIRDGTSGSPGVLENFFTFDDTSKYGLITKFAGIYMVQGKLLFGSTTNGNDTYFKDTTSSIILFRNRPVNSGFYEIKAQGNSTASTQEIYLGDPTTKVGGPIIKAENSSYTYNGVFSDTNILKMGLFGVTFYDGSTIVWQAYNANKLWENTSFVRCGEITASTGTITSCSIIGAPGNGVLIANNHNVTDCSFISNVNGVHLNTIGEYNFTDLLFSGNTYDVNNTYGSEIIVNLLGSSNANTYTGSLVTFVANQVLALITVKDIETMEPIENVRVYIEAADNSGPLNFKESVTITRSDTTATVSHASHGLSTGALVRIEGSNQYQYNGIKTITYYDANSYTFTVDSSADTPATGTITSTTVLFNDLTDASGEISITRSYLSDQPITGKARKGSAEPLYKSQPINGIIDSGSGMSLVVLMVPD